MKFPELLTLEWLGMDLCREARTQKCFVSGLTEEILSLSLYLPGPQLWSAESGSGEISATIFHGPFRPHNLQVAGKRSKPACQF